MEPELERKNVVLGLWLFGFSLALLVLTAVDRDRRRLRLVAEEAAVRAASARPDSDRGATAPSRMNGAATTAA